MKGLLLSTLECAWG